MFNPVKIISNEIRLRNMELKHSFLEHKEPGLELRPFQIGFL